VLKMTKLSINKKMEKAIEIFIFTVGISIAQLRSDHNHLKGQFRSLASDFKSQIKTN